MATTFYSKAKNLLLSGAPGNRTVDFSGDISWPGEGKGRYETDDAAIIAWLLAHPGYGIDFSTTPFTPVDDPPKIYTREEKLELLIDSVVVI